MVIQPYSPKIIYKEKQKQWRERELLTSAMVSDRLMFRGSCKSRSSSLWGWGSWGKPLYFFRNLSVIVAWMKTENTDVPKHNYLWVYFLLSSTLSKLLEVMHFYFPLSPSVPAVKSSDVLARVYKQGQYVCLYANIHRISWTGIGCNFRCRLLTVIFFRYSVLWLRTKWNAVAVRLSGLWASWRGGAFTFMWAWRIAVFNRIEAYRPHDLFCNR